MYADVMTNSMGKAISETYRRREIQEEFNIRNGIVPTGIRKAVRDITDRIRSQTHIADPSQTVSDLGKDEAIRMVKALERQMKEAAQNLEFEKAAMIRDRIVEIRSLVLMSEDP